MTLLVECIELTVPSDGVVISLRLHVEADGMEER